MNVPALWAEDRKTHPAIARAIWEISTTPEQAERIWAAPTLGEGLAVQGMVEGYLGDGDFSPEEGNGYPWGDYTLTIYPRA